jgi:cell division protein FtsQ
MPRKSDNAASKPRSWVSILAYAARLTVAGVLLVGCLYGLNRAERFLVRDTRFSLITPDFGLESPSVKLEGLRYASRMQVLRIFSPDFGRSVYLLPLAERRDKLKQLDWVRDASISRIWPNRLYVRIQERVPAAYLQIPSERALRIALIDADGIILQPPARGHFELPVVSGIASDDVQPIRRDKVRRLLLLMKEIGGLGERVSEVDVADRNNIKLIARAENRSVTLWLGDQNFLNRFQSFVNHYPDIQRRLPGASIFDLRLDDRITVVEDQRR